MRASNVRKGRSRKGLAAGILILCFLLICGTALLLWNKKHKSSRGGNYKPGPAEIWKEFSGEKAFVHTQKQVDFGPRPAGSKALDKTREYLVESLQKAGWQVEQQKFTDTTPHGPTVFVNLIARFQASPGTPAPTDTQQAIVCSHYDTKWFDTIAFLGANDGASSSGALLELARVLALDPAMAEKIELVFFDGEEAVGAWSDTDSLYGSRHYAKELNDTKRNKQFKFGILWDMIGKKDVSITLPTDSPKDLAKGIFAASQALGQRDHFTYYNRDTIADDHVPLNTYHIPTIDLIDFDYMAWHTADDTMDKLSPESLQIVGSVTLYYLKQRLAE